MNQFNNNFFSYFSKQFLPKLPCLLWPCYEWVGPCNVRIVKVFVLLGCMRILMCSVEKCTVEKFRIEKCCVVKCSAVRCSEVQSRAVQCSAVSTYLSPISLKSACFERKDLQKQKGRRGINRYVFSCYRFKRVLKNCSIGRAAL